MSSVSQEEAKIMALHVEHHIWMGSIMDYIQSGILLIDKAEVIKIVKLKTIMRLMTSLCAFDSHKYNINMLSNVLMSDTDKKSNRNTWRIRLKTTSQDNSIRQKKNSKLSVTWSNFYVD
ncbi:hypothetical protein Fmac_008796 [Flemingia macrophylla]|uniref:Uncharacterized protein n=1 Tax=Flemingia macrophylla TaxID=520843 RepID=A0ABD1MYE2_9FABA